MLSVSCRVVGAVVVVIGCTKSPSPQKLAEPTNRGAPLIQVDAGVVVAPVDAPAVDASVVVAPVDAPAVDASVGKLVEMPGRGTCTTDADCVLTTYQEGCCVQACQGYASSKAELAARQAKENCAARGNAPCPPPSPCRRPTHKVLAAKCSTRRCVSIEEKLPAPP